MYLFPSFQQLFVKFKQFQCKITLCACKSCSFTQIIGENALFSGKIYTAGTNFTRPLVAAVATNLNSAMQKTQKALTYYSSTSNCSCSRECTMMLLNSSTWMDVIIILYRFVSTEPYFVGMSQVIQPGVVLQNLSSELVFLLSLSSFFARSYGNSKK